MSFNRIARINEEIKRDLSGIIRQLKDPRISHLTSIVSVDTTKDLKYCKVYVSVMDNKENSDNTIDGLKNAAGFIRKELGRKIKLRNIPELIFILDDSIEHGAYISKLLKNVSPNKEGEDEK